MMAKPGLDVPTLEIARHDAGVASAVVIVVVGQTAWPDIVPRRAPTHLLTWRLHAESDAPIFFNFYYLKSWKTWKTIILL